jgi:CHASE2 domain-containing sensor protein
VRKGRAALARIAHHVNPLARGRGPREHGDMTALAVTLLIIGIVLLLFGVFVEAVQFLLWIGIIILVIAVIAWLMRFIRRQT